MKHWTVTSKADGTVSGVITEDSKTPFECGYDAETHDAVELTTAAVKKRDLETKKSELLLAAKRVAAKKIEAIAPLWRQLNDLNDGPSPEADARRQKVLEERNRSNLVEADLSQATTLEDLLAIFDQYSNE